MSFFQEVSGGPGAPQEVLHDQLHVQHEEGEGNNKVVAIWGARKNDQRVVLLNRAVVLLDDEESYTIQPQDRHIGVDTTSGTATATLPAIEDSDGNQIIEDGHRVTVEDDGGNAGAQNITVATEDDASVETSTISTNNAMVHYMYVSETDNWKDVS